MRSLSYMIAALIVIAWLIGFLAYGTTGLIQIPPTTIKFDVKRITGIIRRTVQAIGFCGLIFILSCCSAHYVAEVPVAPIEVRPIAPFAGAVWIDGGWAWRGGHHTWVGGYWDHPRSGRVWQAGEWRHGPRGHYWVAGRWK